MLYVLKVEPQDEHEEPLYEAIVEKAENMTGLGEPEYIEEGLGEEFASTALVFSTCNDLFAFLAEMPKVEA